MGDLTTSSSLPLSDRALHLLILFILASLLLIIGLGEIGLTDRDEGSNAEAAREMLESGDWISPTLNYEPRYAKPAFTYWIIGSTYALFGVNEFTARLPSVIFGLGLLLLQYFFLERLLGTTIAFLGSLILLLNAEFVGIHRMVLTDPELVFFTTLSTYSFWIGFHGNHHNKWYLWLFYMGMAFAMLAKGPVGIIIPLLAVIPYLTLTRQWKNYWKDGRPILGWILFIIIAAPWYLTMLTIHGTDYMMSAQANTMGRFFNPMEGHSGTMLFYIPILLFGFFPWSGLLPVALAQSLKNWKQYWVEEKKSHDKEGFLFFSSLWVITIFLFFTLSATRLPHYIMPLYPAASLLAAVLWYRFLQSHSPKGFNVSIRIMTITGYILAITLASVPGIYEEFKNKIALEFPAAAQVGVGYTPFFLGAGVFLGVIIFRQLVWNEKNRAKAFLAICCTITIFLLVIILFALPHYGKYFIAPPQQLAAIANLNLGTNDHLIQFGRKRPSLAFYAKRKIHFINPGEDTRFKPYLQSRNRFMIILQSNLHSRLPENISIFPIILQRYGFILLSSEPLVH